MDALDQNCPAVHTIQGARRLRPRLLFQFLYHARQEGLAHALKGAAWYLFARHTDGTTPATPAAENPEPLHLQPGEMVEVLSEEEIQRTLDSRHRQKGLLFVPEMRAFCGKRYRVRKRLERMYLEPTGEIRKVRHTVLLEDVFCDGKAVGCDRSCFLYWREAWLRRVPNDGNADEPQPPSGSEAAEVPPQSACQHP